MVATTVNPYGYVPPRKPGDAPGPMVALSPHPSYAVPDVPETTDPTYTSGYSPELKNSPNGATLPDDIRMGVRQPPLNDPNDAEYLYQREANRIIRESDQVYAVDGWKVQQRKIPAPIVPLWTQERMPIRPTADTAPAGYLFERPWHIPRFIQDAVGPDAVDHLSMADHRRKYPINTMVPRGRVGVNTYRADPRPWDEDLQTSFAPSYRDDDEILSSAAGGNRSWRL